MTVIVKGVKGNIGDSGYQGDNGAVGDDGRPVRFYFFILFKLLSLNEAIVKYLGL